MEVSIISLQEFIEVLKDWVTLKSVQREKISPQKLIGHRKYSSIIQFHNNTISKPIAALFAIKHQISTVTV